MIKLDERDIQILATLQREGRITKSALAERVNLSPSPCWERLKRLEDAGVINGYHARLDLAAIRQPTVILVEITIQRHQREDFDRFEQFVQTVPEIVDCWATGGGIDYLVRVFTQDVDAYQRLIDDILMADVGVDRYFTYIVTRRVKESPEIPLERIL